MGRDPERIFQEGEVHTISYSTATALAILVRACWRATGSNNETHPEMVAPKGALTVGRWRAGKGVAPNMSRDGRY